MFVNREHFGLSAERHARLMLAAADVGQKLKDIDESGTGIMEVTPKLISDYVSASIIDHDLTVQEGLQLAFLLGIYSKPK